jgi:hypothetical protein
MSAYVVDKEHVDLLTRFALRGLGREGFSWWQVNEEGQYAGWRKLDELATGEDPERFSPSQFGQLLLSENVKSVSHRYSEPGRETYYGAEVAGEMEDTPDEELPGPCDRFYLAPYLYTDPGYTLTPGELFAAIDCLDYQSCEHPGWRTSEAFALLEALRNAAGRMVDGYAKAPWGWTAADLAKVSGPREFSRRVI